MRWLQNASLEISRVFGRSSSIHQNFRTLTWSAPGGTPIYAGPGGVLDAMEEMHRKYFEKDLDRALGLLRSALDQLDRVGLEQLRRELGSPIHAGASKVFVSHGHAQEVLQRVEDFLRALGCDPVVVEKEASGGQDVDDLVEKLMEESQAVIILATGESEADGAKYPRPNVIHEIGLAQRMKPDRIIYLKELGCEFPSNVKSKVWETFTQRELAPAFLKIAKELHQFGLY